eukprot:283634-Rhodomonas_salina.1
MAGEQKESSSRSRSRSFVRRARGGGGGGGGEVKGRASSLLSRLTAYRERPHYTYFLAPAITDQNRPLPSRSQRLTHILPSQLARAVLSLEHIKQTTLLHPLLLLARDRRLDVLELRDHLQARSLSELKLARACCVCVAHPHVGTCITCPRSARKHTRDTPALAHTRKC